MRSLYDGQENHYKKMLDLQERLRKSEEERIRLEEKFNLLVQESRNRHQSCINQLRLRYVEFLEEQRERDERNNKLLGTLDKVDSSLALMTAKTERLNILRKQYEAYLLRAYGTQRTNGSATADSGLESQNDREISPTPAFTKSIALIRKNSMSCASSELPIPTRRTTDFELPEAYRLNAIQKSSDIERDLNEKFAQAAAVPSFYDEVKDVLKARLYFPSYLADSQSKPRIREPAKPEIGSSSLYRFDPPKYTSTRNIEPTKLEIDLRKFSVEPPTNKTAAKAKSAPLATSTPSKYDLDRYLNKIRQAQAEALEHSELEPERSFEDADQEQNTSGDLLNVTLSDDGNPVAAVHTSPEEEPTLAKDSKNRFRALLMRRAYAAENGSRNRPIERTRHSPISKLRGGDAEEAAAIDKFRQSEIATPPSPLQREIGRPFTRPPPLSVDDAFAKLDLLSEPRRSNLQRQNLPVVEDVAKPEDVEAAKERETRLLRLAEADEDDSDKESKNDDEEEEEEEEEDNDVNGDGIEDDYDDTVDIDSWMPDDAEQQVEEVHVKDDVRDIPRRKLESIEEVEHLDDDEDADDEVEKPDDEKNTSDVPIPSVEASPKTQQSAQATSNENAKDVPQTSSEKPAEETSEVYATNEQYANQQYYPQDDGTQQHYQENAEYAQNYEQQQQQQGDDQQNYQYSEDPNQQYGYDENGQYTGYDGQQYTAAEYEEYMKQYQNYDPNQAYEHDPNQQYQQYEGYQTGQQADGSDQVYDYSQDPQAYGEGYSQDVNAEGYDYTLADQQAYAGAYAAQSGELYGSEAQAQETTGEQSAGKVAADESTVNQTADSNVKAAASTPKDKPKEAKKKKDVIKSILESDSDSFIERNLSNTESDFDFN